MEIVDGGNGADICTKTPEKFAYIINREIANMAINVTKFTLIARPAGPSLLRNAYIALLFMYS